MMTRMGLLAATTILASCGGDKTEEGTPVDPIEVDAEYSPDIDPADFVDANGDPLPIDNPYFPQVPGTVMVYDGTDEEEVIHVMWTVTTDTIDIGGVTCVVVNDHEEIDGELAEDTFDWFAQDSYGNVWYFGEESTEYENNEPVSTEGSWKHGENGAIAGIIMEAAPNVGDAYRQEYLPGEAEDMAEVTETDAAISVPMGDYTNVVVTRELNPFEACVDEAKHYAEGVGMVRAGKLHGGAEVLELTDVMTY